MKGRFGLWNFICMTFNLGENLPQKNLFSK